MSWVGAAIEHEMAHKRHYTEAEKAQARTSELEKRLFNSLPYKRDLNLSPSLIAFATSANNENTALMNYCYEWMEKGMPELVLGRFRAAFKKVQTLYEKLPSALKTELKRSFSNSVEILSGED